MRITGLIAVAVALFTAGCALSPTAEQVTTFGKAADTVVSDYTEARQVERDLVMAAQIDKAAHAYLAGGRVEPGTAGKRQTKGTADVALPAVRLPKPSPEDLGEIAYLDALSAYVKALTGATDPAGIKALETAATGFAVSSATFIGKVAKFSGAPAPSELPVVAPALRLIAYLGVDLAEYEWRNRIRTVVAASDDTLFRGTHLLLERIKAHRVSMHAAYEDWREARRRILIDIRHEPGTAYATYVASERAAREFEARLKVLDRAHTHLGRLHEAHSALLQADDSEFDTSMSKLQEIIDDLAAIKAAL